MTTYLEWLNTDTAEGEEAPAEPSVSVIAKKAAKLATGAAASAGGSKSGSTSRSTFTGKRGDNVADNTDALAAKISEDFVTVNEIADFVSKEYTNDSGEFRRPSQGAISSRLFPTGGKKLNLEGSGVTPAEVGGKKGATKN